MPRLVLISDTHLSDFTGAVPEGDILVHAGDLTQTGELSELESAVAQLRSLPHPHKIVIAGNHDFCCERRTAEARALIETVAVYLQDEAHEHAGIKFYGSPWQPWFHSWAFNVRRGAAIAALWAKIPDDVDVLVTHGPPHGILDQTRGGEAVGCEELMCAAQRVRPKVHVFGHIHEAYGTATHAWPDGSRTLFVNASLCGMPYLPLQRPIVLNCTLGESARAEEFLVTI